MQVIEKSVIDKEHHFLLKDRCEWRFQLMAFGRTRLNASDEKSTGYDYEGWP